MLSEASSLHSVILLPLATIDCNRSIAKGNIRIANCTAFNFLFFTATLMTTALAAAREGW